MCNNCATINRICQALSNGIPSTMLFRKTNQLRLEPSLERRPTPPEPRWFGRFGRQAFS